jgi:hypothetical protein
LFVLGKLFQPNLTNTNLVRKIVNYGQKSFITFAPGPIFVSGKPEHPALIPLPSQLKKLSGALGKALDLTHEY